MPLDLKSTLNLPKTDFSMKANLPKNEPKMLERWEKMRIYDRIREAHKGEPIYVMHDGPPYANGPIHLGTALNKTLKDFIVKSRSMSGFDAPYVPGWDCHGLPIEIKVDDQLGRKKLDMDPLPCGRNAASTPTKYLDLQRSQFKRLGVFGRWDKPYATMDSAVRERRPRHVLHVLPGRPGLQGPEVGLLVRPRQDCAGRGRSRVRDAHQPEHLGALCADQRSATRSTRRWKERRSRNHHLDNDAVDAAGVDGCDIPPDAEYVALEYGRVDLHRRQGAGAADDREVRVRGSEGRSRRSPARSWSTRLSLIRSSIARSSACSATTSPWIGHGRGSHRSGPRRRRLLHRREVRPRPTRNVDEAGILRNGLPEYDGKQVFKANPPIVELLKSRGVLLGYEKIEHSYPHCWRCHNPIIFRATEQWFISMEAKALAKERCAPRARRDQESEVGSRMGRGPHLEHGRHPPRLVHLAPARLGRAHRSFLQCEGCKEFVDDPAS